MNLKYLATAAAATALMGGAALAQPNSVTPDQPNPVASAQSHSSTSHTTTTTTETAVNPAPADTSVSSSTTATSATTSGADVSVTTTLVTNGPVPDTAENRAKYGQPMSRAGKRTAPAGN